MRKLVDFIQTQLQRHGPNNGARVSIPKGFKPSSDPMPSLKTGSGTRRWEVRNSGVRRQVKSLAPYRYLLEGDGESGSKD
jgi:hypothetical protein